jgi:hypothetical protein
VDAEVGRGVVCVRMLVRFGVVGVGQGVAPLKVNARDYSGLGARWEFWARAACCRSVGVGFASRWARRICGGGDIGARRDGADAECERAESDAGCGIDWV